VKSARHFSCSPESVRAARAFIREVLRDQPSELIEAAELLTSELASNCIRHAGTDFALVVEDDAEVRVEVRDCGEGQPMRRTPSPQDPSGRGLFIVDALSASWVFSPDAVGKTVWFTLPRAGRPSTPRSGSAARLATKSRSPSDRR